jgi:hypothetical protein
LCIGRLKKYVIAALKCFVASILNAGQPEFLSLPLGWFGALRRGSWEKLLFVCREDKIVVYRMTRRLIGCKRHSQDTHAASEREKKKKRGNIIKQEKQDADMVNRQPNAAAYQTADGILQSGIKKRRRKRG